MILSVLVKQKFFRIAEIVHLRIFGHEMGEEMRKFLGNLSISFFGGAIASVLLFTVSVLLGRFLGPIEYGRYALYVALFSFLSIFLSFGLETTIVRLAAKADEVGKKRILSTFVIFFFVNSLFWSLLFFIFNDYISRIFGLSGIFVFLAVLFSITNSLVVGLENYLKLLNQFVFVNTIRVFQGCFLLLSIILVYFSFEELFSLKWFIILNITASILILIVFLLKTRSYLGFIFDKGILKELSLFSSALFLGLISGYLIQNGTNVLIGKFLGSHELGLYNAYYILSMTITGQGIAFFISAYFPALAKSTDKIVIIRKIDQLVPIISVPWLIISVLIMLFGINMYGSNYPFDIQMVFLFSLYSLFYLFGVLYGLIVISNENNKLIRNMYIVWLCVVLVYFLVLFLLSLLINVTIHIVLLIQVVVFGINAFLNRYYCGKIAK